MTAGPVADLMPSYIPFALPESAAFWMLLQRSIQYSLAQRRAIRLVLLRAALKAARVDGQGLFLWDSMVSLFNSMTGCISFQ